MNGRTVSGSLTLHTHTHTHVCRPSASHFSHAIIRGRFFRCVSIVRAIINHDLECAPTRICSLTRTFVLEGSRETVCTRGGRSRATGAKIASPFSGYEDREIRYNRLVARPSEGSFTIEIPFCLTKRTASKMRSVESADKPVPDGRVYLGPDVSSGIGSRFPSAFQREPRNQQQFKSSCCGSDR